MIYETVRNLQFNNTAVNTANSVALAQPADDNAKALGLDSAQVVGNTEKAINELLTTSQDQNGNKIADTKELPGVVEHGSKTDDNSNAKIGGQHKRDGFDGKVPQCQCEACRKRRYQDGSDDNGVSCQTPTKMIPTAAAYKVKAHEMEHVRREQMQAKEDGKKVISQSVRIKRDICEECGRSYVSGGTTVTVTRPDLTQFRQLFAVGSDETLDDENAFDSIA